jgi:flagellar basal-body rod protein FlgG
MQIALEASQNGILSLVQKQDLIANNLANVNTTAFKKSNQSKADFPIPGTQTTATPTDFSQGDLLPTSQDLDLAIQGDGFFTVQNGGIPAYTRAGNFHIDRDGNLVTPQGYQVDPAITFPPETERVEVGQDGNVFAISDNGATSVNVGRLEPVRFQNTQGLVPIGDNLFIEGPDSGPPLNGSFGDQGFPTLRQRFLEQSNVDLAQEITDELIAQRAFQANIRTFQTTDQLIGSTLDLFR